MAGTGDKPGNDEGLAKRFRATQARHAYKKQVDVMKEQGIRNARWIYSSAVTLTALYCALVLIGFLVLAFQQWPTIETGETVTTVMILKVSILWGGLGGAVYSAWALVFHLERLDFDEHYLLWYFLRPVIGMGLGTVVVLLVLGGLLVVTSSTEPGQTNLFLVAGISALSGIAQKQFVGKLNDLSDTLFSSKNKAGQTKEEGGEQGSEPIGSNPNEPIQDVEMERKSKGNTE